MDTLELEKVVAQFQIDEQVEDIHPYGSGHINDTYRVVCSKDYCKVHYILQRINHNIFTRPLDLQNSVELVTDHLKECYKDFRDGYRRSLQLVRTRDGKNCYVGPEPTYWRVYEFAEHTIGYDVVESESQAYQAAKAFGQFMKYMSDIPSEKFAETIPDFHNTPKRFEALEKAIAEDKVGRAASCKEEIEFALSRKELCSTLLDLNAAGKIPMRVTHNDTKLNNVLLDSNTHEGICVIDLDTVMPGLAHYDFGDLIRTSTSPAKEDERDLSKVQCQLHIFEALLKGYLGATKDTLNETEIAMLPLAGRLITFEIGLRFLTDYLSGDVYFKVKSDDHNLVRCRTQFRLVECQEEQAEEMEAILQKVLAELA